MSRELPFTYTKRYAGPGGIVGAWNEFERASFAHAQCLPTPRVIGIDRTEVGPVVRWEYCSGTMLADRLLENPDEGDAVADELARLHVLVHRVSAPGLDSIASFFRVSLLTNRRISAEEKRQRISAIDGLAPGNALCHGDFHPGNVIETASGPMIVDWHDAGCGSPACDVAWTVVVLASLARRLGDDLTKQGPAMARRYLETYRNLASLDEGEVSAWIPIVILCRSDQPAMDARTVASMDADLRV